MQTCQTYGRQQHQTYLFWHLCAIVENQFYNFKLSDIHFDQAIRIVEEEGKLVLRRLTTPTTDPWQMVIGIIKDPHIDVDTEIEEMRGR